MVLTTVRRPSPGYPMTLHSLGQRQPSGTVVMHDVLHICMHRVIRTLHSVVEETKRADVWIIKKRKRVHE